MGHFYEHQMYSYYGIASSSIADSCVFLAVAYDDMIYPLDRSPTNNKDKHSFFLTPQGQPAEAPESEGG